MLGAVIMCLCLNANSTNQRPIHKLRATLKQFQQFVAIFLLALQPLWALASFQSSDLFTTGWTLWAVDQLIARPQPKHRTAPTELTRQTSCPKWDSNPRSQRPSERRQFMP
jgi:hypothetical protein